MGLESVFSLISLSCDYEKPFLKGTLASSQKQFEALQPVLDIPPDPSFESMGYCHWIGQGHRVAKGFEIGCNMPNRPDFVAFSQNSSIGRARNRRENRIGMQSDASNSNSPHYELMPLSDHAPAQPATNWPLAHIPAQRRVAPWILLLVLVIEQLLIAYFQLLAFPNPSTWFPPMVWLSSATGGIVDGTLVGGVTLQLILFPILLFWLGRLRPKDVGLDLTRLLPAIPLTVLIWIACQVLHIAILLLMAKPIEVNPAWGSENWRFALSDWLGQLFGNCPFEEVLFRGFLLPQCLLLAMHWLPESKRWKHLTIAMLLSQGLFAFGHVIFNMKNPEGQWLLIAQFVFGLLFAAVYLRTGNLFLAIGIHALINNPAPLLSDPLPGPGVTGAIVLVGCLLWLCISPWWSRLQAKLPQTRNDSGVP
jgi:hypothetical protein